MKKKILWITNVEPSYVAEYFGRKSVSGHWIDYSSKLLVDSFEVELYILSLGNAHEDVVVGGIHSVGFEMLNAKEAISKAIDEIIPDVVHIWGTEFEHFLISMCILDAKDMLDRTVVSIQGLVSECSKYYCFALPQKIIKKKTLYERLRHASIEDAQRSSYSRGEMEKEGLKITKHCIGRTDWDKAITRQINRNLVYHKCNEILRPAFYNNKWNINLCEKHSIVFSQSGYILKGFHIMVEALRIVKEFFPDARIYAIGNSPYCYADFEAWIKRYSYSEYVGKLIKEKNLCDSIEFVGFLDEQQMVNHYLRGNVFVCASGIENSSNSVGEAMMLGMPIVASDVGGIKTFIEHNGNGILYQSDSANMLADGIIRMFEDSDKAMAMGEKAHSRANEIYNPQNNTETLMNIYNQIC